MASMIQNYIHNYNTRPQPQQQKQDVEIVNVQKHKPKFDINRELANRTFIKPLQGQGHLIHNRITDLPAVMVKDFAYDMKALKDGYQGKANDHQLGKLNDKGLVIGGLSLAAFLATVKQTPKTKAMEFIGLGSFLASMAIWPKVAIQWPAQLIHGVNIFQQYEDSFGRKKNFYQDPQFIPWDLYSDDEINKIGDRLGVPRDMENRRDFIQDKMRKIAVQNNTLWMLTAGFATPVMSALICNQAEPYVEKFLNNWNMKKADSLLSHFSDSTKAMTSDKIIKNIDNIIALHKEHNIDDDLIKTIAKNMTEGMDALTTEAVEADLQKLLKPEGKNKYNITSNTVPAIIENAKKTLTHAEFNEEVINAVIPSKESLTELFESKGLIGKDFSQYELQDVLDDINELVRKNINDFNTNKPGILDAADKKIIIDRLFSGKFAEAPISKSLIITPAAKLDARAQTILKNTAKVMTDFKAKTDVLDKYAYMKFAAAPETGLATYWNDVAEDLIKIFKFTPEEIKNTRMDREVMTELLRDKMENIASDDAEYKRVMKAICEKINTMSDTVKVSSVPADYTKAVNETYDTAAAALEGLSDGTGTVSLNHTAQHLVGPKAIRKVNGENRLLHSTECSLKKVQHSAAESRILEIKSTFEGFLNSMNFYRKVATNSFGCLKDRPREIKEEAVELGKQLAVDRHMVDFETKFYMLRNPNPNMEDLSELVVEKGKVKNQYYGMQKNITNVDVPQDWDLFKLVMESLYKEPLHPDTETILKDTNITGLKQYRENVYKEIGDTKYFAKLEHFVENGGSTAGSERKFLLLGMSPDELFSKVGLRKYNTNTWLKIFGTVGAVLLGVTLGAQFFFGRLKPPEKGQKG